MERSPKARGSASSSSNLEHCDGCEANSADTTFAAAETLSGASRKQCVNCYHKWSPLAYLFAWTDCVAMIKGNPQFAAKWRLPPPPAASTYRPDAEKEVLSTNALTVKLSKNGRLLTKAGMTFGEGAERRKYTAKQLRLKSEVSFDMGGFKAEGHLLGLDSCADWDVEVACTLTVASSTQVLAPGRHMEEIVQKAVEKALVVQPWDRAGPQAKSAMDLLLGKAPTFQQLEQRAERCSRQSASRRVRRGDSESEDRSDPEVPHDGGDNDDEDDDDNRPPHQPDDSQADTATYETGSFTFVTPKKRHHSDSQGIMAPLVSLCRWTTGRRRQTY